MAVFLRTDPGECDGQRSLFAVLEGPLFGSPAGPSLLARTLMVERAGAWATGERGPIEKGTLGSDASRGRHASLPAGRRASRPGSPGNLPGFQRLPKPPRCRNISPVPPGSHFDAATPDRLGGVSATSGGCAGCGRLCRACQGGCVSHEVGATRFPCYGNPSQSQPCWRRQRRAATVGIAARVGSHAVVFVCLRGSMASDSPLNEVVSCFSPRGVLPLSLRRVGASFPTRVGLETDSALATLVSAESSFTPLRGMLGAACQGRSTPTLASEFLTGSGSPRDLGFA